MAEQVGEPDGGATERGRQAIAVIMQAGIACGLEVATEYPVQGGRIDVVWLWNPPGSIPGIAGPLPIAGFEVESSWRTRKHLKGDFLNLADLSASVGVIVLLGDGPKVEATRTFAQTMVNRPGVRMLVWSQDDLDDLSGKVGQARVSEERHDTDPIMGHAGKYQTLWAWLAAQPEGATIPTTFGEIEEILGMPLPLSCRRHPAHWSSHQGSAVARAIHDAGYRATDLDLATERVTFKSNR